MRKLFTRMFNGVSMSPRDRFLRESADLADLEFRQKAWDRADLERSRFMANFTF